MVNFYWDERNGMFYRETVFMGITRSILGIKPVNVEIIELNCMEVEGNYYQLTPYKGPIKRMELIKGDM